MIKKEMWFGSNLYNFDRYLISSFRKCDLSYFTRAMYFMDIIIASINDVICLNVEKFSPYKAIGNHPFCKYLNGSAFIQWIYVNRSAKCKGHLKQE